MKLSFNFVPASILGVFLSLSFLVGPEVKYVRADWDPVLEAQEAAQRKAAAAEAARRKAESDAKVRAAELKYKREYLGAEGQGLSDSQVDAAYTKKLDSDKEKAIIAQREGMAAFAEGQKKAQQGQAQTNAAMKEMTGKSVNELMNMSEEELEKFANDMEKKFGATE